jgi:hypothetical protein
MADESLQEQIKAILLTVVGQAFRAAGFELQDHPMQHAAGQYRFIRQYQNGLYGVIEFQVLLYVDSEWASGMPSRFRVTLSRSDQLNPTVASEHPAYVRRDLSQLVVDDFSVAILPSNRHWWTFKSSAEFGHGLAEAGHLIVGYGIPWLAGDLQPPDVG